MLTPHFCVSGREVAPLLDAGEIDNGLVDLLMDELRPLGLIEDQEDFERLFVEVVLSGATDEDQCWSHFYRNTLRRLDAPDGEGCLAVFSRIYARAAELVGAGPLLDLGSGFGFFALRHTTGEAVVGCDASAGAVAMASRAARRMASPATFVTADALRLPFASASFDAVSAIHLLEHLEGGASEQLLAEAMRVARRCVVLAVPLEAEPETVFGHRQRFSLPALDRLADRVHAAGGGWRSRVLEADGGWLVLDR